MVFEVEYKDVERGNLWRLAGVLGGVGTWQMSSVGGTEKTTGIVESESLLMSMTWMGAESLRRFTWYFFWPLWPWGASVWWHVYWHYSAAFSIFIYTIDLVTTCMWKQLLVVFPIAMESFSIIQLICDLWFYSLQLWSLDSLSCSQHYFQLQ